MIRDIDREDRDWIEGKLYLPWTEDDIVVAIVNGADESYAEKCAEFVADIGDDILQRIAKYAYRYYRYFIEDSDDCSEIIPEDNILEHCWPCGLVIEKECRPDKTEFHMEWGCDWEEEHGMEVTVSDGKILYVGPYEGYAPWDTEGLEWAGFFDENEEINYNFADNE